MAQGVVGGEGCAESPPSWSLATLPRHRVQTSRAPEGASDRMGPEPALTAGGGDSGSICVPASLRRPAPPTVLSARLLPVTTGL